MYVRTVIILDCSLVVVSLIVQDGIIVFGSTIHLLCTLDGSLDLNNGRNLLLTVIIVSGHVYLFDVSILLLFNQFKTFERMINILFDLCIPIIC
jgi:hypothetical protein